MRKIGVRDEDALGLNGAATEETEGQEGPWFDNEPLFIDEVEPVRIELPGRPEEYICVQIVSDGVAKGRARFYRTQSQAGRKGQIESTSTVVDAEGLALYIRDAAITDFYFKRRGGGEIRFHPKNAGENRNVYRKWTGKFAAWVDEQIAKVNGWSDEEEEKRERFPAEAA